MNLINKTVLITGATGTLGRALAQDFRATEANLIVQGRNQGTLSELAEQLSLIPAKGSVDELLLDLAELAEQSMKSSLWRRVDILINNAAIQGPIGPLDSNQPGQWLHTLKVNLLAPAILSQAVIPFMKARGFGRIINISGGGASGPRPFFSAYGAAKAALVRLTETLAHELPDTGITVNAVAPGAMTSAMTQAIVLAGDLAGYQERQAAQQLLHQAAHTRRAVELCLFLASEASNGITGRLISAQWDNWQEWPSHLEELEKSDLYTLRRITGRERGQNWGDK